MQCLPSASSVSNSDTNRPIDIMCISFCNNKYPTSIEILCYQWNLLLGGGCDDVYYENWGI